MSYNFDIQYLPLNENNDQSISNSSIGVYLVEWVVYQSLDKQS